MLFIVMIISNVYIFIFVWAVSCLVLFYFLHYIWYGTWNTSTHHAFLQGDNNSMNTMSFTSKNYHILHGCYRLASLWSILFRPLIYGFHDRWTIQCNEDFNFVGCEFFQTRFFHSLYITLLKFWVRFNIQISSIWWTTVILDILIESFPKFKKNLENFQCSSKIKASLCVYIHQMFSDSSGEKFFDGIHNYHHKKNHLADQNSKNDFFLLEP